MTATQFSHTGKLAHNTTNDTRLSDFMGEVREFGRDAALGRDSLPKLAHAFVRAVCDGVLDPAKDHHGRDAAERVFDEYANSDGKKAIHERNSTSVKAQYSKLRQLQNFAASPKWDAVDVMNTAFGIHKQLQFDEPKDVKPAYAAYVDLAREQLKQDDTLSDEAIEAVMRKSEKTREVTLESELKAIQKRLAAITSGDNKHGIKDNSPNLVLAQEHIDAKLNMLMTASAIAEEDAALEEINRRRAARAAPLKMIA